MESVAAVNPLSAQREDKSKSLSWGFAAGIALLFGALYYAVILDLASDWWNLPEASYGMLVPPTALYIAYLRRRVTFDTPAQRELRGLFLALAGCILLLVGSLAAEFFLTRVSVVPLLAGLVWTFWGLPRLKTLAFPFVLLATMVPLPAILYNFIAAPLQLFASTVATSLAQDFGISVYRDGNIIHLANATLGVEEACSGLHSLPALVVGSLLLGFLDTASIPGRVLLFLFSVPLAIAVNVFRVTGTAILADYHLEFAMGFYHLFSGWLFFVVGFGALWLVGKLLFRLTRGNA